VLRLEFVAWFGRRRLPLAGVLAVVLLERAARVEHATEELLLSRDGGRIETSALERVRQCLCFLRQLRRAVAPDRFTQLVELLRNLPLLARQRSRRRLVPRRHRLAETRQETLRLRVDPSLLLCHVLQLLQHVREAGRRAR